MRKNLLVVLTVFTGLVISLASCLLEDIETVEKNASRNNLGITVNIAAIEGLTSPMHSRTPVTSITSNEQYTGTVSWSSNNRALSNSETFNFKGQYTATITLKPNNGYTLHMVGTNFFTVEGAKATNSKNSGVIQAVFSPAAEGIINIAAIPLAEPIPGGTPVTSIENEQYTGTVAWSPEIEETFDANTQYTADITLAPKTNFTLQGVKANFFTVNGATSVNNSANSGVIKVVFPQTKSVIPHGGEDGRIEYYWVDQHDSLVTTSGGAVSIITGSSLTITPATQAQSAGYVVKKWYVNGTDTGQTGNTYTFSITTIGKHTVDLFLEKESKLYSTSITIEVKSNELTAHIWTNGNITTSTGEQLFKFTATDSTQYIHVILGTLTDLNVQLYDSNNDTVGSPAYMYSSNRYISRSVTSGQVYYIKVTPYSSSYSGTYQITFNASSTAPITLPSNPTTLTANTWASGNIASNGGEQWFKFTATDSTQYIHASFGTLDNLYIQVYNSSGYTVGYQTNLYGSNRYTSQSLTSGREYYIKVTPYSSANRGTYQIAFNTSTTAPINATTLTANTWASGNITSNGEQWFKFTATASLHYIHASFGTLDSWGGLYVQIYDSTGSTVTSQTRLYSGNKYTSSSSLTSGQEYYIKVTPYSYGYSGTYQIAFNTSSTAPVPDATVLTANTWASGNITSNGEQWFKFTATGSAQYIHASFGTLADLYIQVYNSSGNTTVGNQTRLYSSNRYTSQSLTSGQEYYIKVTPYYSGYSGTYQIAFNTSSTPPSTSGSGSSGSESNPITLTAGSWNSGSITSSAIGSAVWYSFSVTSGNTYRVWWDDMDNSGGTLDIKIAAYYGNGSYIFDSDSNYEAFTANQTGTVKLKVYPLNSGNTGTFRVVYSTSSTRP